jgi:hypothetical protein
MLFNRDLKPRPIDRKLGLTEKLLLLVCSLFGTYVVYAYNMDRYNLSSSDSAGFVDLIRAVAYGEGMVSQVFTSLFAVLPLLVADTIHYCAATLQNGFQDLPFWKVHLYLIIYFFKPFVSILGVSPLKLAAMVNAANLALGLSAVYLYLRTSAVNSVSSVLFVLAIMAFPLWVGDLNGQYYFDRLFFLPGLLLMFYMVGTWQKRPERLYAISALFLISASISERIAIICSIIMLLNWLLEGRFLFKNKNILYLILGLVGIFYVLIYMKGFQDNHDYNVLSPSQLLTNVKASLIPGGFLFDNTMKWFIVIAPFSLLAFLNIRRALLVCVALGPNLVITMGGGERIGFLTHYHSVYFPVLLGIATINFAELFGYAAEKLAFKRINYKNVSASLIALTLILYGLKIDIASPDKIVRFRKKAEIVADYAGLMPRSDARKALHDQSQFLLELTKNIPTQASISAPDSLMPVLVAHGSKRVDFFPVGIGSTDYIFTYYVEGDRFALPSYVSSQHEMMQSVSQCIQMKIDKIYSPVQTENHNGMRYVLYRKRVIVKEG